MFISTFKITFKNDFFLILSSNDGPTFVFTEIQKNVVFNVTVWVVFPLNLKGLKMSHNLISLPNEVTSVCGVSLLWNFKILKPAKIRY